MKKLRAVGLFLFIILLGGALRLWQLSNVPPSLDWDEASLGWNAVSLLKTGTDEYGINHPLTIRSFNDYKPAGYVYGLLPIIAVLGVSDFSIRLLSALAGIGLIGATFVLVRGLSTKRLAFISSFLIAISPWSLQFSRGAFEANLALFFVVAGAAALVWFIKRGKAVLLFSAILLLLLGFYSYHSTKVFVPLLLVLFGIVYYRELWQKRRVVVIGALLFCLALLPAVKSSLFSGSGARFTSVSIFAESAHKTEKQTDKGMYDQAVNNGDKIGQLIHHRLMFFPRQFIANYIANFDLKFLFLESDTNKRHHAPDMGLLYLVELPLLFIGLFKVLTNRPGWAKFVAGWVLIAPLAAATSAPAPHAIRALLLLPAIVMVVGYGINELVAKKKLIAGVVSALLVLNVFYFAHQYFIHNPIEYASDWQYGYKQMVEKVVSMEGNYSTVYVTTFYDQPYIYFLLYGKHSPTLKNPGTLGEGFGKYIFKNYRVLSTEEKRTMPTNALYIVAPGDEIGLRNVKYVIRGLDGQPLFFIGENVSILGMGALPN